MEAYKVGITIALNNRVSRGLTLIAGQLGAANAQAMKLRTTLNQIKLLGVGGAILGGTGLLGFHTLGRTVEAAKEYRQALAQFRSLNLGDGVNAQADKFARGASVIGASATDLMRTTRDLTAVLGNVDLAKALAPGFAQLKFANQAVYGGKGVDFDESQIRSLEKIIEMKGGFKSPQEFLAQAGVMQQVIAGTGGMVKPSDYMNFVKTAGVAGRLMNDKSFYYGMEPLIQEMGGNRVGTGLMSAYNNLAQGRSTVRASTELMRLGLIDPRMVEYTKIGTIKQVRPGALRDDAGFGANPYQWMQSTLLPAMKAKGITSEQGILREMGVLFGNRTASNLFSLMFLQQEKIAKNMKLSEGAMSTDQLVKLARQSPQGAEIALGKSWENLKVAAGEALLPIIIPAMNGLAAVLRLVAREAAAHPHLFNGLIYGLAGLSGALLFSGSVLTLKAAFLGFRLLMPSLAAQITSTVIPALGGLTAVLGPLAAVAATIAGIANHKEIAAAIDKTTWGQKLGDSLLSAKEWLTAPSASPKTIQVNSQVNLDGRKVADAVTTHQVSGMSKASTASASGFDYRSTPLLAGGF